MTNFQSYTIETVPERSKDQFQKTIDKYGAELNIFRDMAESPLAIELYSYGQNLLNEKGTLNNEEVNLVQLAVSVENGCHFCVPAHTGAAKQMKTADAVIQAIRTGETVPDSKIEALVNFTRSIVQKRGFVNDTDELRAFLNAGYTPEQVFEIITIAAYKTITNYTSAFMSTEPNDFMAALAWHKSQDSRSKTNANIKAA